MKEICQKRICNTIRSFQVTIIIEKLHPESVNSALRKTCQTWIGVLVGHESSEKLIVGCRREFLSYVNE